MEQEYIIENVDSFNVKDIFDCGQCFRWNEEADGSYTGIFEKNVLNVKQEKNRVIFKGICDGNIKEICTSYFDLDRDYNAIKQSLAKTDKYLREAIGFGAGIRILNQDLWETTISFIISANNNIPRIKKIIEKLSLIYGDKIIYNGKTFYTFPTPNQLEKASVKDLRNLGLGFRDIRVYETTREFTSGRINEEILKELSTEELHKKLCELSGVGPKVADCIEMFSTLKRLDVFPVDVWVRKVMNELYIKKEDVNKVTNKEIQNLATQKFGNTMAIAQQYLFYWRREKTS